MAPDSISFFAGRAAIAGVLDRTLRGALRFVDEFFRSPGIRGVDFALGVIAGGWVWAVSHNPINLSRLADAGLGWVPRNVLIAMLAALAVGHLIGWLNPRAVVWRVTVLLLASWFWITVGVAYAWAITTGGIVYLVVGFVALLAAIHIERHRS